MNNEFKKSKHGNETRYTLESASGGATGAGSVASVDATIGSTRRRGDNLIAQEGDKITVPVTQKPRLGPLRTQTGGGPHRDRKKEQKQGKEKHKKPFMEDHEISMASNELKSIYSDAKKLLMLVQRYGEQGDLEAWQQSKITKAADYLNSVLQSIGGEQGVAEGGDETSGSMAKKDYSLGLQELGKNYNQAWKNNPWKAELVDRPSFLDFEVQLTNPLTRQQINFILRPVDMTKDGGMLSPDTFDVRDLQTGETTQWFSGYGMPLHRDAAWEVFEDPAIQKDLRKILNSYIKGGQKGKNPPMLPGLKSRSDGEVSFDADDVIGSGATGIQDLPRAVAAKKTQDALSKAKQSKKGVAEESDDVQDTTNHKERCQILNKLRHDPIAMKDPTTRQQVLRRSHELGCDKIAAEDHSTMTQGYGRESSSTGQAFAGRMKGAIPEDAYFQKLESILEEKQRLDPKCWKGYKKSGTKIKGGVRVNKCVPAEGVAEGSEKNKAYTQGGEAGKKSHRAENNPYKSGSPEHRDWEAGRKGTVPDRSRFLPSKKGVAEQQVDESAFSPEEIAAINQYLDDEISFIQLRRAYPRLIGKAARQFGTGSTRGFRGEMDFYDRMVQARDEGDIEQQIPDYGNTRMMAKSKLSSPKATAIKWMKKMYGDGNITFSKTSNGGYFVQHEDDFGDTHSHQYDPKTGKVDFRGSINSTYYGKGVAEDWQKVNKHDKTDGMSRKAVKAYRRENPGSKLKTAVTTKPSKLKKGGKAAKRRKSFCARMSGMKKAHASAKTKRDPDSPINKALRRWNCHEDAYMNSLSVQVAEKLNPQADVDVWVQDFQKADPNRYHQFKNKTPQKKAQMAQAAHYAANEPSKKK